MIDMPADQYVDAMLARLGVVGPDPDAMALINREIFRQQRRAVKYLRRQGMIRKHAEEVAEERMSLLRNALAVRLLPAEGCA